MFRAGYNTAFKIISGFTRYLGMLKGCGFAILCFLYVHVAGAQQWSGYVGAGVSYDAFLRDKTVMTHKVAWPFQVGASLLFGGAYHTENGFNIFGDVSLGFTRFQFPVPDVKRSRSFYEFSQWRFMIGSGPKLDMGRRGSFLTPFIKLGATFLGPYGSNHGVGDDDPDIRVSVPGAGQDGGGRWSAICGAGIDWQFHSLVPSSLNLQLLYTPLNLFYSPVSYTAVTRTDTYDLAFQGKMMQLMLSWKVHLWVKNATN